MRILYNTEGKSGEPITIEKSDTLTDGSFIFSYTQSQDLNTIDLSSLETGVGMFWNSNLSDSTLEDIATTIKTHPNTETHIIDLGNNVDSSIVESVEGKGWTVKSFEIQGEEKYSGCLTVDDIKLVDAKYKTTDIVNGVWTENLDDLTNGYWMFRYCENLTTFSSDLPSLTYGENMFYGCIALTSFSSDLPSLMNSDCMFRNCTKLTSFTSDLPSLTYGYGMFMGCTNLTTFSSDLSSLEDGEFMFDSCQNLTSFTSDLSSLTDGHGMFIYCENLTTFSSDLSSLTDGSSMFNVCNNLTSFTSDLSSLTDGGNMFYYCYELTAFSTDLPSLTNGSSMFNGCKKLGSFSSDLSSLKYGDGMFLNCKNLTTFSTDLPSLTNGFWMFNGCKLNADSIVRIANSLPLQWKSEIHIGNLGESINTRIIEACELMGMKGWTVKHGENDKVYTNQRYIPSNKYDGCKNTDDMTEINSTLGTDAINGFWIHPLKDLEDGRSLFVANRSINNFCADLSSLKYGGRMFYSINGSEVDSLINFCSSMPNLLDGESMFGCDTRLKSFKGGLKSLTNGFEMFYDCTALSAFNEDLTTLTNGAAMFRNCTSLSELNFDLQSMVDGTSMFCVNTKSYTSFKGNLSSLVQGHSMFRKRLCSFDANLSSLEIGKDMFKDCCLDKKSIKKIASSIKRLSLNPSWTYPDEYYTAQNYNYSQAWWKDFWDDSNRGIITLGIDLRLEDDNELQDYLKQIEDKNWEVEVEYNEIDIDNKIKYINCITYENVSTVEPHYGTVDVINGIWSEPLPNLRNGSDLFKGNVELVSFNTDLSSLVNGALMFNECTKLISFNGDLSSLTSGTYMFSMCPLTTFSFDLSKLTKGWRMFKSCRNLTSFSSDLRSLTDGDEMFHYCENLESFSADLRRLTDGSFMFGNCKKLTSFNADLRRLTAGSHMFDNCSKLESFSSDLRSLTHGWGMFSNCTALTSFSADLSSLIDGRNMFKWCKLDAPSVQNIANTINDLNSKGETGEINIGHATDVPLSIVNECGNKLIDKGWTVYFNNTLYEYTPDDSTEYDVSEANGWCPDAYKNGTDSWNAVVLRPHMDELKISEVNEKGEMLNDD